MKFEIKLLESRDWVKLNEQAHFCAFGEKRDRDMDRIDFALLAIDPNGVASGYISCLEMDKETIYWQYGGAMPNYKGSVFSFNGYREFIKYCGKFYKRITTRIENTNLTMLKMALKMGFLIMGTYTFKNKIFVELCLEFGGENA